MEDFLKNKLNELENNFQDDWNVFEEKLERALFFKRLRIGAAMSLFLIATSIGIFGTSSIIDFHSSDEAPFGVYTEEGFESSGSKSEWGGEAGNVNENIVFGKTNEVLATENVLDNDVIALNVTPQSEGTQNFTETNGLENPNEQNDNEGPAITAMGGLMQTTDQHNASVTPAATDNGYVSTSPAEAADNSANQSSDNGTSGESQVDNVTTDKVTVTEVLANVTNERVEEVFTGSATAVDIKDNDIQPPSQVNEDNIVAAVTNSTVATEEDIYELEQLDLKTLKLDLPSLGALGSADGMGLQVRMPVSAFKVSVPDKGPFISPLQGKSLWEYSLKVYPNFTFRKFRVDEDKANYIHRDFVDQVQASESGGFSLNIGLEISRRIGLATYLKGGLEYISYNHSANFDFTNYRGANIDDKTGAITSYALLEEPNQVVINDKNTYHYLNLPLSISYQPWASDHIRLNMEAGVSYMYFVAARGASIDYRTLEIIDLSDREFKNSLGSINLRVGATYYISPQFNLGFEPTFVYFTNTIYTDDYPFEVIPYSVGLNLKLQVKLN